MSIGVIVVGLLALFAGLGVGSAGLLVVWLTLCEGMGQLEAQGVNLLFFILSSGAALIVHVFRTRLPLKFILLMIPAGLVGSFFGTLLAGVLPQLLLRRVFGAFLVLCGIRGGFGKGQGGGTGRLL